MGTFLSRRALLVLTLVLAMAGVPGTVADGRRALAQGAAIDCPVPAASPVSGATAAAASLVATDVAFPEGGGELTVFAAASLTDAFAQMKGELEAAHPGLAIRYNFAGSQALVTQLSEGAAADVFASANNAQMQAAIDNGAISGEPVTFVRNRLAVVTPADNPAGIASAADLGDPDLLLVLAQAEVPVGRYARESVCAMGKDNATYGEDFVNRVAANIVSDEEDVRDVLAKVQLGEADVGIVYVSDAGIAGDDVRIIEIPDAANIVASYPIAAVNGGNQALANAFIAYVLGADGQATLGEYGFTPVSSA